MRLNKRAVADHIDGLLQKSKRYQIPDAVVHPASLDPEGWIFSRVGIRLDPWQVRLVRDLPPRICLNTSRQAGKSTAVSCMSAVKMVLHPGTFVLAIAPSWRQSRLLLDKVVGIFLPEEISRITADTLELTNGSKFISAPGDKPATIRGLSPQVLLMDEFSRIKKETVTAILPSVAAQGHRATICCLSTPAGASGPFYEYWNSDDPDWVKIFVSPEECSRYTPEILQTMKSKLSRRQYQQEFEGRFLEAAGGVFSADSIAALFKRSADTEYEGRIPETQTSDETFVKLF